MTKVCKKCGVEKELAGFNKDAQVSDGHKNTCRECQQASFSDYRAGKREDLNKLQRDRRANNPAHTRNIVRKSHFKTKYGLSLEDREAMRVSQNNKCLLCESDFPILQNPKRSQIPCVDHSHTTGKVRGLLCSGCNFGLGQFKDSVERLQKAISYLQKSSE